ncbi:MAG: flagellar biosynthesis protein FliQ [Oceanococcaceae bacterium]
MTTGDVVELLRQALNVTFLVSAPLLLVALVVGLIIGLFQAATQVNEMTLSFIPKLIAIGAAMVIAGNWMLDRMVSFTRDLIINLPTMIS